MRIVLMFCVLIFPSRLLIDHREQLIVWNVGQGQFVTAVTQDTCFHFDMGGETFFWNKIRELCVQKKNRVYFSHWDWDHISFTRLAKRNLPNLCVAARPGGKPKNIGRLKIFESLRDCESRSKQIRELKFEISQSATSNELSRVFEFNDSVLIPGDSTSREEKFWSQQTNSRIKLLILGHHGSRTSTSKQLTKRFEHLRTAIASARRARYGHPHRDVVSRAQRVGASVLKTEDWGNIRIVVGQQR